MTDELLLISALVALLGAVSLVTGWWRRHIEHEHQQRQERERRVLETWHEPPANNHGSSEGNHTV
jgi:hypothetical protein